MAIWKENNAVKTDPNPPSNGSVGVKDDQLLGLTSPSDGPRRFKEPESLESVIAADLAIEGKIEGAGHVRLVGKFKGDVHVGGDLTIEKGAKLTGSVRAGTVVIAGELEGNIDQAAKVELLATGVLNGDLKAGSLTVAAGSRMRGAADFGWADEDRKEVRMKVEARSAS